MSLSVQSRLGAARPEASFLVDYVRSFRTAGVTRPFELLIWNPSPLAGKETDV